MGSRITKMIMLISSYVVPVMPASQMSKSTHASNIFFIIMWYLICNRKKGMHLN